MSDDDDMDSHLVCACAHRYSARLAARTCRLVMRHPSALWFVSAETPGPVCLSSRPSHPRRCPSRTRRRSQSPPSAPICDGSARRRLRFGTGTRRRPTSCSSARAPRLRDRGYDSPSPGAGYGLHSAIGGAQPDGRRKNAPRYSDDHGGALSAKKKVDISPGPGQHAVQSTAMGSRSRVPSERAEHRPAPPGVSTCARSSSAKSIRRQTCMLDRRPAPVIHSRRRGQAAEWEHQEPTHMGLPPRTERTLRGADEIGARAGPGSYAIKTSSASRPTEDRLAADAVVWHGQDRHAALYL